MAPIMYNQRSIKDDTIQRFFFALCRYTFLKNKWFLYNNRRFSAWLRPSFQIKHLFTESRLHDAWCMKIYLLSIDNNTYLMMTSKPQIFARGRRGSVFSQGVAPIPGVSPVAIQRTQLELGLSGLWWRLTQASEIDFRHGKLAFIGQMTFVVIPLVRA